MVKYFRWLRFFLVHKWLVLLGCAKHGLWWRGITHDLTKLRPKELTPYVNRFFGDEGTKFKRAWLYHVHRNDHHWQYWVSPSGDFVVDMPIAAAREMVADWCATGKQLGVPAAEYYLQNRGSIKLAHATRHFVESELGVDEFIKAETVIWKRSLAEE